MSPESPVRRSTQVAALTRIVSVGRDDFAADYWGIAPLLSRGSDTAGDLSDLFDAHAVDELVSVRGLRTPFVRLAKNGRVANDREFTSGGGIGAAIGDQISDEQVYASFRDGSTVVLQGLHRTWEPILAFAQQLAAELGHPVQVNAYVTPPQSTGFTTHYDVHDVFVLQITGSKHWQVRPPVNQLPLRDQPWEDYRAAVEAAADQPPVIDALLRPGDCLYLPRGYLHAAEARDEVSIHLTVGVHTWTRAQLAEAVVRSAVARATSESAGRSSLPIGVDFRQPQTWEADFEVVRAQLVAAISSLPAQDLVSALAARARDAQRSGPLRPLAQAAAYRGELPDRLRLRAHLDARLEGSRLVTRRGAQELRGVDPAVAQALVAGQAVATRDLGDAARELVGLGLAVAVSFGEAL